MGQFVPVETSGGVIWAEVDDTADVGGIVLAGANAKFPSFEEAVATLKANATYLREVLKNELAPTEVEISCGIKVGVEGGNTFWGLAKATSEASYTVNLKWKTEDGK
jgi:hypothetical protein